VRGSNLDRITLAHGGGGAKTERLIRDVFQRHLKDPILREMDDGALLEEGLVFSTDSFVVNPLVFPGGDIGRLAVSGTVNDLAVMGAEPRYLSLGFILEEGLEVSLLERIVKSIGETGAEAGVRIVAGDTKVVERGKADGLFVNSSGIGKLILHPPPRRERLEPGDLILINGPLGLHGMAILLARGELGLEAEVESDVAPLWSLIKPLLSPGIGIKFMRDPTRGGLAAVLNEAAEGMNFGIRIWEEALPITEEVEAICEVLGFDPLQLPNEGKVLIFAKREGAEEILEKMRDHPLGREAAVIGEVIGEHPGKVLLKTRASTHRIVEPPLGELLPRIC